MKLKFLLLGVLLTICSCQTGITKSKPPSKKVEIVSPDFGILTIFDRTRDGNLPLQWRCFAIKDVKVNYRKWANTDPENNNKYIETMCDFEIWVNTKPFQHVYHGRRGKPESYCKNIKAAWEKLTQKEEYVCMDGETLTNGEPTEDEESKKMRASWTWDKIKTKKGCYSFWNGYNC